MLTFDAKINRFQEKGEKTGWTYIEIRPDQAEILNPGIKKSFRVKGFIDNIAIKQIAVRPMGDDSFILPLNGKIRKELKKTAGQKVKVAIVIDNSEIIISPLLLESLEDDPEAKAKFEKLPPSHQKYYSRWIEDAKTEATKVKRIVKAIKGLSKGLDFGAMTKLD
jgi:hypothetical protein